jgi:hypothetical protein
MQQDTPVQSPTKAERSSAPVVLRILLAILLALPALAGIPALVFAFGWWSSSGFDFDSYEGSWAMILIAPGIGCVLFSVIGIGIVLRFARWKRATTASLVLSVVAMISIVLAYGLSLDALKLTDTMDRVGLLILAALAILVAALPPFLHWWKSR